MIYVDGFLNVIVWKYVWAIFKGFNTALCVRCIIFASNELVKNVQEFKSRRRIVNDNDCEVKIA